MWVHYEIYGVWFVSLHNNLVSAQDTIWSINYIVKCVDTVFGIKWLSHSYTADFSLPSEFNLCPLGGSFVLVRYLWARYLTYEAKFPCTHIINNNVSFVVTETTRYCWCTQCVICIKNVLSFSLPCYQYISLKSINNNYYVCLHILFNCKSSEHHRVTCLS